MRKIWHLGRAFLAHRIRYKITRGGVLFTFAIVVPYKTIQKRRGEDVYGDPPPVKTCPACLSSDLPAAAAKCKYCGSDQPSAAAV